MDFKIAKFIGNMFVCLCLLLSCDDGHKSFQNIQVVWATDYSEDGLDFLLNKDTTYIYPDSSLVFKGDMIFCVLSDKDFSLAKEILKNYFDYHLYDRDDNIDVEPFRLRKYFRQYIGYKTHDSLYVYVNMYTHYPTIPEPECLCTISPCQSVLVNQKNGGKNYCTAIIDVSKKKVVSFKLSHADPNFFAGHYSEREIKILFPHLNEKGK